MADGRWESGKHPQISQMTQIELTTSLFPLRFGAVESPFSKAFARREKSAAELSATVLISLENSATRVRKFPAQILIHLVRLVSWWLKRFLPVRNETRAGFP